MLGLSTKSMYGLAAMYELAKKNSDQPTKIKDIAKTAQIPQNFLEQILLELKKSGLLVSIKGAHGGYKLAKKPEEIMIYEIIQTVEDNFFQIECKTQNPILKLYWQDTAQKLEQLFKIALSDLEQYEEQMLGTLSYSI